MWEPHRLSLAGGATIMSFDMMAMVAPVEMGASPIRASPATVDSQKPLGAKGLVNTFGSQVHFSHCTFNDSEAPSRAGAPFSGRVSLSGATGGASTTSSTQLLGIGRDANRLSISGAQNTGNKGRVSISGSRNSSRLSIVTGGANNRMSISGALNRMSIVTGSALAPTAPGMQRASLSLSAAPSNPFGSNPAMAGISDALYMSQTVMTDSLRSVSLREVLGETDVKHGDTVAAAKALLEAVVIADIAPRSPGVTPVSPGKPHAPVSSLVSPRPKRLQSTVSASPKKSPRSFSKVSPTFGQERLGGSQPGGTPLAVTAAMTSAAEAVLAQHFDRVDTLMAADFVTRARIRPPAFDDVEDYFVEPPAQFD